MESGKNPNSFENLSKDEVKDIALSIGIGMEQNFMLMAGESNMGSYVFYTNPEGGPKESVQKEAARKVEFKKNILDAIVTRFELDEKQMSSLLRVRVQSDMTLGSVIDDVINWLDRSARQAHPSHPLEQEKWLREKCLSLKTVLTDHLSKAALVLHDRMPLSKENEALRARIGELEKEVAELKEKLTLSSPADQIIEATKGGARNAL